ncbi:Bgt-20422 [Blumeria graminis f. sp. tritici]|uniref:Bgt-20422 n=1 Tax=Blumeria graminis f. sp. tritici TaxID=62690 RepID=A0A9X9PRL2_BLUGR|nr:Bgt-20422 [Blumeria graminis f. sp. tritici]
MQILYTYRPRILVRVVTPLLRFPYSSPHTVPPLTNSYSNIHSEEPLTVYHVPPPTNELRIMCGCMAAGGDLKVH